MAAIPAGLKGYLLKTAATPKNRMPESPRNNLNRFTHIFRVYLPVDPRLSTSPMLARRPTFTTEFFATPIPSSLTSTLYFFDLRRNCESQLTTLEGPRNSTVNPDNRSSKEFTGRWRIGDSRRREHSSSRCPEDDLNFKSRENLAETR